VVAVVAASLACDDVPESGVDDPLPVASSTACVTGAVAVLAASVVDDDVPASEVPEPPPDVASTA
jgi:hypothetical protein